VQRNPFSSLKYKYLAIYRVKFYESSSTHSYTSQVQDPIVRYEKKSLCTRNDNFDWVFLKKVLQTLGFKCFQKHCGHLF